MLLVGPPGCGKTTLAQQFIYDGLVDEEPCIYLITDHPPEMARESMRFLGFDVASYEEKGLFRIIDCYSGRAGIKSSSRYVVESPANLTDVSIKIQETCAELKEIRFVLDSITTLTLDAGPSAARNFLQVTLGRIRQRDGAGFIHFGIRSS